MTTRALLTRRSSFYSWPQTPKGHVPMMSGRLDGPPSVKRFSGRRTLPCRGQVHDRRDSGQPGLVVMLGAEVAEHLVREVAFEQLGGPLLPAVEQGTQLVRRACLHDSPVQLARARRRAGPLVEHRDQRLPPREARVEDRPATDQEGANV